MSLGPGTRLGPYEVVEPLGTGGMGEVYRARDTRLGRDVAIKVLPATLNQRRDLRARLQREAKAVSSLNHPHICTLHDIGIERESTFLVMELLEGQPLSDRLSSGPIPVDEALGYSIQIASALSAAHRAGLIHRDLKPGNVMLTRGGAKLLDFGLAKTVNEEVVGEDEESMEAATLTAPLTIEGSFLGTPQYMAPEQLAGQEADARTDVFALGALMYEMLTGARAFSGKDRQELFRAILHTEPKPPSESGAALPSSLERVVLKCLAKERDARWQCVPDLTDELRWIESTSGRWSEAGATAHRSIRTRLATGVSIALVAGSLGLLAGWQILTGPAPAADNLGAEPIRLTLRLPEDAPFLPVDRSSLAISANGRHVVYTGGRLGDQKLYMRSLGRDAVRPLDGTEGGVSPFFSPDGETIGFFTRYSLRYVATGGGPAQEVTDSPPVTRGAVWLADGDVLASPAKAAPLVLFAVKSKGPSRLVTRMDPAIGLGQSWPDVFDDGKKVLVTVIDPKSVSYDQAKIVAIDLKSGAQRVVLEGGSQAHYLPTGHLVFIRESSLFAAPFDVDATRITAAPTAVVEHVLSDPRSGVGHLAISSEGTLVYAKGDKVSGNESTLEWMDSSGRKIGIPAEPRTILTPRLAPDGRRIALAISAASDDLWLYDFDRGAYRRLTFGGRNMNPIWTPDGSTVTYSAVRGFPTVYNLAADGSGQEELVAKDDVAALFPGSWSPDGQTLALSRFGGPTGWDVYTVTEGATPEPFAATRFNESAPAISPDGGWIAYCSDESGSREVYVTSFPHAGQKIQVSAGGGAQPVWMPRGLELLYRSDSRLMAAKLRAEPRLRAGAPSVVISNLPLSGDSSVPGAPFFDVTPDGRRFLVVQKQPLPGVSRLEVVLNWFSELERRVPSPGH
jgi:serine/threonine protein kinase/Tol biopolymer transport system component